MTTAYNRVVWKGQNWYDFFSKSHFIQSADDKVLTIIIIHDVFIWCVREDVRLMLEHTNICLLAQNTHKHLYYHFH